MTHTGLQFDLGEMQRAMKLAGAFGDELRTETLLLGSQEIVGSAQVDSPVLSGFMKEKHFARKPKVEGRRRASVTMGVDTDYAAAQHEKHPTKSKWFLRTIAQDGPGIMERAGKAAFRRLERGRRS